MENKPEGSQNDIVPGSKRIRVAMLLAVVGGFLDAYTFTTRGGVFANAQTGNVVMLCMELATGGGENIIRYICALTAFFLGILLVMVVEDYLTSKGIKIVRRLALIVETLVLGIVMFIPQTEGGNILSNSLVSCVCAIQMEAFKTFRSEPIATTMTTGNLRKLAENVFYGWNKKNSQKLEIAWFYFRVILSFMAGVFLGVLISKKHGIIALWMAELFLIFTIVFISYIKRGIELETE